MKNNYEFYKNFIEIFLEKYTGSKNIDIIKPNGAKYAVLDKKRSDYVCKMYIGTYMYQNTLQKIKNYFVTTWKIFHLRK